MILEDFQENYGNGWIKLYRSIKQHWIWQDSIKFKWWIDILISVNHSGKKINIGYDIFECKPGQSIKSLKTWADEWDVSKDTVRNFFTLLKKDNMIKTENLKITTRITVCNYDTYQSNLHDKQTQSKRKANAKQTQADPNKNDKNVKNDKYLEFYKSELGATDCDTKIMGYYVKFIEILYGKNDLGRELSELLNLEHQVTYKQFSKLYIKSVDKNKKFSHILPTMTNDNKYYKNKKSLYLCLNTWLNNDFK
jgi:DNA-binding transcriptional regulator YhcF (GntR family)